MVFSYNLRAREGTAAESGYVRTQYSTKSPGCEVQQEPIKFTSGDMRTLLKELANFREHVLDPIEHSMHTVRRDHYTLLFHVRFGILEYRARAVLAPDNLTVVQALLRVEDPSNEVQRQAEVLQSVAIQECVNCIE